MPETTAGAYGLAVYQALVGDRDQALRYLRRGCELDKYPSTGYVKEARKNMPSLNGDPEFEAILAEYEKRIPLKEEQDPSD